MIIALLLAAATPTVAPVERAVAICREAYRRGKVGDLEYLERGLERARMSEDEKAQARAYCFLYVAGRRDEARR